MGGENHSITGPQTGWIAGGQIQGERDAQEDFVVIDFRGLGGRDALAIVCDGMGGRRGGALASETAATVFASSFAPQDGDISGALIAALQAAHDALVRQVANNPYLHGLGTTLVAAHISGDTLHHVSVGDSILWLVRDGACRRINADHSVGGMIARMQAEGRESEAGELSDLPASTLFSALTGDDPPDDIDLPADPIVLQEGDVVVLASDGVLSIDGPRLAALVGEQAGDPVAGAQAILDAVTAAAVPGQDNASVIVAAVCLEPGKGG
jgi:serine/threonine protein phosphatase PrpC